MNSDYKMTIGLEIHAELKTKSKMWCGCKNDPFDSKPNQNVCPICIAEPGTLPAPNKEAIEKVIRVGLAFNSNIADFTEFDRKNYFYPDIPKGYQISQYKFPIVSGGSLAGVDITRVHLEEDTAKSIHDQGDFTLIDFNRAGVPLMELVTEACIHSAEQASNFAKELQLILKTLDVSEANMEMGQMRVEVNFSVSNDLDKLGTKVEVKNLNSFKTVEKAIEYEYKRHVGLIESGKASEIVQETRGWDEIKQVTYSQRAKENAHDYRYFPDPDLPKMYLHSYFSIDDIRSNMPELPADRRLRLENLGLKKETAEVITNDFAISAYFDKIIPGKEKDFIESAANYLASDIIGLLRKDTSFKLPSTQNYIILIDMFKNGELSSRGVKDILQIILRNDTDPKKVAIDMDLIQKNDNETLEKILDDVIKLNEVQWQEYKAGNDKLVMYFVGQCMKASNGSGNPGLFQKIIKVK